MKLFFNVLFIVLSQLLYAQICDIEQIDNLLEKEQFALVYSICDAFQDCESASDENIEWIQYQQSRCALELFNDEAEIRFEDYLSNYPHGKYRNKSFLALSKIHFRNKEYDKAIAKLNMVDVFDLDFEDEAMYYFRLGYSYFITGKYDEAKIFFFDINKIKFTYSDLTTYCLGHMAYEEGNYATALKEFNKLMETPKLGVISKYYITHIYYYQHQYEELIDFAKPLLEASYNPSRDSELARLIGSAYYALDDYESSVSYMQKYLQNNSLNRFEQYQLAISYFELGQFDESIKHFENILLEEDSLSQFAAHQLAKAYLNQNEKAQAINAFKYASEIDYDLDLKEDAAFNHVKLIFEQKNTLEDAVSIIEYFIEDYPVSIHKSYVQNLLIKAYTSTKNYQSAIDKLSVLTDLTFEQQQVYQKLSYFLALENYLSGEHEVSIEWFKKSLKYPLNSALIARSYFWMGEAYYQLGDYNKAIEEFNAFQFQDGAFSSNEYSESYYSLAFSYFQIKQYDNAIKWFRKYIKKSTDKNKLTDSYLRIGDSYFMTRKYNRAIEYYVLAEEKGTFDIDFSIFQQSTCYGLTNKQSKKRDVLTKLIAEFPTSIYHDDAILSLSSIYSNQGNLDKSVELLNDLIKNHPNSPLVKVALLNIGLNYYNDEKNELAVSNFKKVIEDYPNSTEAKEALIAFKNLSVEQGDVSSYFKYIDGLSDVSVDVASKDSLSYEASENLYLNQKYDKAALAFSNYLTNYEDPIFKLKAHYYKAECLYLNNPEDAIEDYLMVLELPQNDFTERSLIRLSRIEFERGEYGTAAFHYNKLLSVAQDNNLIRESTLKLFTCYTKLGIKPSQFEFAEKLLQLEKLDVETKNKAKLVIANHYFEQSEYNIAKKEYDFVSQNNTSELGAEAKYQLAYLQFLAEDLDSCESTIYELSEKYYSDYYVAKAFILLSDIYFEKENYFQSKATLQSIVDNYQGEDLVSICKQKISNIEALESQEQKAIDKEGLIIDSLDSIELNELFEEENTEEDEE
ncbi:MAG: tetratricopeptide repeat protein [Flavobacteriales bacterium]|nr:tetratricopeptide repeat protein [Flavobacteriales bacterium]MBL6872666.1 tetratricopeptide repeat protein [Flavobacteriales bacterium]